MPDAFRNTTRTFQETGRLFNEQFGPTFRNIFAQLQQAGSPLLADLTRSSTIQGNQAGMDIQSALARSGASGTGPGLIARSIASTMAANQASQSRFSFLSSLLGMAGQGALQTGQMQLGSALEQINTRAAQPSWWQTFLGNIPGLAGQAAGAYFGAPGGGGLSNPTAPGPRPMGGM